MNDTKFKRKDGFPTEYAFACGYGKQHNCGNKRISLYHNNGSYEVKAIDWDIAAGNKDAQKWAESHGWNDPFGFRAWENFTTLSEAINFYRKHYNTLFK